MQQELALNAKKKFITLNQRLKALVQKFAAGNTKAFAQLIESKDSTFRGYLSNDRVGAIKAELLYVILDRFPEISRDWLFFGEGPMLKHETPSSDTTRLGHEPYSVRNGHGDLIGDLLRDMIYALGMDQEEFFKQVGATEEEIKGLRQSAIPPSWETLVNMARLGINLQFLTIRQMPDVYPQKEIDRILKYLQMTEWELAGELTEMLGTGEVVNQIYKLQKNDQTIPHEWRAKLVQKFGLSPSWTRKFQLPTNIPAQGKYLAQEVTRLKGQLLHLQDEHLHAMSNALREEGLAEETVARIRSVVTTQMATIKLCDECGKPIINPGDPGAELPQPKPD